jgi:hypothetical protein
MLAFATPGPIVATVSVAGARVRVRATDRTDTVVLVEPVDSAKPKDVRVAAKAKVDFCGGRLTVKTTVPGDNDGSVAITIDVPAGSSLIAYTAHSSVRSDGPLGECELHIASSRVELDRVDALQATMAGSEVVVEHIAGSASVQGGTTAYRKNFERRSGGGVGSGRWSS